MTIEDTGGHGGSEVVKMPNQNDQNIQVILSCRKWSKCSHYVFQSKKQAKHQKISHSNTILA